MGNKHLYVDARYGERNTHIYNVIGRIDTKWADIVTSLSFHKTNGLDYISYDASGETDENGIAKRTGSRFMDFG